MTETSIARLSRFLGTLLRGLKFRNLQQRRVLLVEGQVAVVDLKNEDARAETVRIATGSSEKHVLHGGIRQTKAAM